MTQHEVCLQQGSPISLCEASRLLFFFVLFFFPLVLLLNILSRGREIAEGSADKFSKPLSPLLLRDRKINDENRLKSS